MIRTSRVVPRLLPFVLALVSLTCSGDKLVLPDEGDPSAITVVDGNSQIGTVGVVLTDSVIVRVTDSKARPVVDARVQFLLGTNGTGGDLIPDTAVTDADGRARARWVLGTKSGTQTATARVVGFSAVSTTITATANPDIADTVFAFNGDGQTGTVGVALAESLVVRVNDRFGNPVGGISVGWSVSGGGTVSAVTVATGPNGQAAVQRILGPTAGAQSAAATVAGVGGSPVVFTHNAVAGGPTALLKIDGDNQTAPAGTFLAESLDVRLVDGSGNGVAGRSIAFTPSPNNGSASPTAVVTDVNGLASSRWTLGGTAGAQSLIASGVGFSVTFNATATSDVPTQMAIAAGNNQTSVAGTAVPVDPSVRVRDVGGNNVPNVSVTFTVTGGGGTVAGPSGSGTSTIVATDANGLATLTSWTLGGIAGPNTMSATASGPGGPLTGSPLSFTATGTAGPPSQITIATQPPASAASGATLGTTPVVQVRDAGGNPISQANINVTVSLVGSGTLNGTKIQPTTAAGQASFPGLSISGVVGPYSLAFSSGSLDPDTSSTITLTPGAPTQLVLTTQPSSSAQSGVAFAQQPVVQIQDAAGNSVPQSGVVVTATITPPGSGSLIGSSTATTNSSGTATFAGLGISGSAGNRTLDFNGGGFTKATSNVITIGAGGATKLGIGVQPTNTPAGAAISPAVTVLVQDASGNTVVGANNAVTVALGANPGGSTLSGTLTVNAVNGVATFSDLSLDKVATGYTLSASSSGLSGITSTSFNITAGTATHLVFTQQPSNVVAGASIAPAVTVTAQDAQNNTVTSYSTPIGLTLGNNPGSGTLTGGAAVTPVNGVATFSTLSINRTGNGYTLVASSGTLTQISTGFNVSPGTANQLVFIQQPSNSVAGSSIAPPVQVAVEDASGNIVTTATTSITIAIGNNPPGNGVLTGGGPVSAVSGIATFSGLKIDKPGTGYTLTADGGGLPTETSANFDISVGSGNKLVFIVDPSDAQVGQAISPAIQVQIQDAAGNPVGGTNPITLVIGSNPGGANLSGGGPVSAVNGIATFSNARLNATGTGYTLTALASGLVSANSGSFDITAASTTTTITSDNPDPSRVGQAINVFFSVVAVAPGSGTPTGTVTVSDGTVTCQASVAAGSCQLFPTTAGLKTITASYPGDGNFTASTSAGASHSVVAANTATVITSDNPDPSVVGQAVTVNFTVTVNAPGDGTPTGNVTVSSGSDSCVAPVSAGSCSLTFTSAGAKTITASYPGDGNFNPSQDTEAHTVNKAATTATITSDLPDPSGAGQAVSVDFTVVPNAPGAGTPTGNVNVTVSGSADTCSGTVAAGTCQLTITTTGTGKTITATYVGDANFLSDSDTELHDVNAGSTTTTITSTVPSASVVGQQVAVHYTVSGSGGTPTGNVAVSDGQGGTCNATVAAGQCNITFSSAGARTLVATYAGDANFSGSTSPGFGHQVNTASTTTSISSDTPDPSTVGQGYTVNFTVSATAPGGGTPTGNVIVSDGLDTCNGTVAAGSCSLISTTAGSKNLVATYQGDGDYTGSASGSAPHTVNKANTTTTITSDNPDPSGIGANVVVNFTVTSAGGTPTGNVTVSDGINSCTGTVAAGTCTVALITPGPRNLTADYAGDVNFNISTSAPEPHNVALSNTSTTITSHPPSPSVVGQQITVNFSVSGGSGTPTGTVTVNDGTLTCNGTLSGGSGGCNLTFPSAGTRTLTATYGGDGSHGGSTSPGVSHQVDAFGPVDPASSTGNVPNGTPGVATVITIQAKDQFGNTVTVGGANVVVTVSGANTAGPMTANDNGDGTYTATYIPTSAGPDQVDITMNGTAISGSPFNSVVAVGPATQMQMFGGNNQTGPAGGLLPAHPTVVVRDSHNNPVPNVVVSFSVGSGGGGVTAGSATTNASGQADVGWILGTTAGSNTLTATKTGLTGSPVLFSATATAAAASQLVITQQPSNTTAASPIAPPVQVAVRDQFGNTVTTATTSITVAIGTNPPGNGALSGTKTLNAVNGIASFSNLSIDKPGNGYTLTVNGGGFPQKTSSTFDIQVGNGNQLAFIVQPSNDVVGAAQNPAVEVEIQDAAGNRIPTATNAVTLALGNNPGGASLTGGGPVNAVGGVATFSNVRLDQAANGYTLVGSAAGLQSDISHNFDISKASTVAAIASDLPDPSLVGQAVTVSYSVTVVAPGSGTPGGTVTVSDGAASCQASVAAGSCQLTSTSAGSKTLTATYAGDANFKNSNSPGVSHTVNSANTTTAILSDTPDPSSVGQAVAVDFAVSVASPGSGIPTGNVTVSDGVDSCTGTVTAGSCNITLDTPGSRTLTATYAGNANFNGSTSGGVPHSVGLNGTTISITADTPDPSVTGDAVKVDFTVSSGTGTPTGNVTVTAGSLSCNGTLGGGKGSCNITFTGAGGFTLTATYGGDATHSGSVSPGVSHQVNQSATTVTITADSPDPSTVGQVVPIDYTVVAKAPGSGTPTGNVTITVDDGSGNSCTGSVAAGTCNLTLTEASNGKTLTATYSGDANYLTDSDTEKHDVHQAATATTIMSDNPDPSSVGQAVVVNFTVTSTGGTPTGNVTVSDGINSCSGTVAAGTCTVSLVTLGARTLTATYTGDANFLGDSDTETHSVGLSGTSTSITAQTPDPSVVGQAVSVDFTVTGGITTPTGSVSVSDGSTNCTGILGGGSGSCSITLATAGTHTLTATYAGDLTHGGSTSAGSSQTVNKAATTATITADNPDPSSVGQALDVDFTVSSTGGTPTGNVTVSDGVDSCTGTVAAGTCAITLNTPGARTLTATYAGDANFLTDSDTETHSVGLASTLTSITSDAPDPSVTGQGVDVDVTVTSSIGTPTGSATVTDGSSSCNTTLSGGSGTCTIVLSSAGATTLTATYGGDATHSGSSSVGTSHTVNPASTAVSITSDTPDPSGVGQAVSVDFTVAAVAPGAGTPTGSVTVSDGINSCVGSVAAGNCNITLLTLGSRPLTATYGGDADFAGDASVAAPHTVTLFSTTTTITAHTPSPSVVGQPVDVDVTVSGGILAPSGSVTVSDGVDNCQVSLTGGTGSCSLTLTTAGTRTLTADYGGDGTHAASTSAGVSQVVNSFGPVDPGSSTAAVPDGQAGQPTTITVQARDQFGNAVGVGGESVSVTISGLNSDTALVTDNGDGTYTAVYTPVNGGGVDTVTITINSTPIQGSPFSSNVP